jgi:signal transduction histidine kinase
LGFKFTAPSFTAPDRVRFKWRLVGLEKEWTGESTEREVKYNFVPPGNYTFQVKACNSDGVWNETGAALPLTVLPYFWQTWWFKIIAGVAGLMFLLGAGLSVQRRRHRATVQVLERRHALERERTRIARDIHDQVGAQLTKIGIQTSMLGQTPDLSADTHPLVQGVAETTREMLQSMDEIVWAINPRNDTLDNAINYLIHYTRDFLRPSGISYKLDLPVDLPVLPLSTERRHNLFMAFKEALNNAVKHGRPRQIRLVLVLQPHELKLAVEDDGCGFQLATARRGEDGLENMRQRMQAVGGHCRVESVPGQGTRVEFQLPLTGQTTHLHVY